tara:strand:+ start:185 stop:475 length:291 start_codon:yes stop_codon:yes gene_type:complete
MLVIINHDKKSYTVVHTVSVFEDISRILTGLNQLGAFNDGVEIYHLKLVDSIYQWRRYDRKPSETWGFKLADGTPPTFEPKAISEIWDNYDQYEVA